MYRSNHYGMHRHTVSCYTQNTVSEPAPCCDVLPVVAHVEGQTFGQTYSVEDAFCNGTLFPELNKPLGGVCCG